MNDTLKVEWKKVKNSLPNLHVLFYKGKEVGFITKPNDTKFDKNAWRCHSGIGKFNHFLGHEYNMGMAMRNVEEACSVYKP